MIQKTTRLAACVALTLLTVAGCSSQSSSGHPQHQAAAASSPSATSAKSSKCSYRGTDGLFVLPDHTCTPGVRNPQVHQATLSTTVCKSGWTSTVRPPVSYTEPLKRKQMAEYGLTKPISVYEEDHLIPLELGGSPADPRNLWPEPNYATVTSGYNHNPKDKVEFKLRNLVCSGKLSLAKAQREIATDWVAVAKQYGIQ